MRNGSQAADERAYVKSFVTLKEEGDSRRLLFGALAISGMTMAGATFGPSPEVRPYVLLCFGSLFLVLSVWFVGLRRYVSARAHLTLVGLLGVVMMHGLAYLTTTLVADHVSAMTEPIFYLLMVVAAIFASTFGGRMGGILAVLASVLGVIVYWPVNPAMAVTTVVAYVGAALAQHSLVIHVARDAAREYRMRTLLAPASIVRQSLIAGVSLEELFSPRLRDCACLSTDLREVGRRASRDGASLAADLTRVYARVDEHLRKLVPDGNYYVDWIAGELFVVIFRTDQGTPGEAVGPAFQLAQALVEAEADGGALCADVGLSFGAAWIGLMGPPGMRKPTALGETPGRARRLQSSAWVARQHAGERETPVVVFGSDVRALLPATGKPGVRAVELGLSGRLRDLDDLTLYYWAGVEQEVLRAIA